MRRHLEIRILGSPESAFRREKNDQILSVLMMTEQFSMSFISLFGRGEKALESSDHTVLLLILPKFHLKFARVHFFLFLKLGLDPDIDTAAAALGRFLQARE